MNEHILTKTKINSGLQCQKKLWYDYHEPIKSDNFLFHLGNRFGEVIRNKKYSVKIKNNKVEYKIASKKNLVNFRNYFHKYLIQNKYDINKVKLLSSLIYLNIAPLHDYPYNEFLFYHGKLSLTKILNGDN